MEGLRVESSFAQAVAGRLVREQFQLADVGCSGGIDAGWRSFGDRLVAVGFDCIEAEVARLAAAEAHPGVRYLHGFVGLPSDHPLRQAIGNKPPLHRWPGWRLSYERTRLLREARAAGSEPQGLHEHYAERVWSQPESAAPAEGFDTRYAAEYPAPPALPVREGDTIFLPAALIDCGLTDIDFLKIDIDGPDFEVLRSASALLDRVGLLGVSIEVNFVGSHDANDNAFHNVDRLMRSKGFDLFGLTTRQYSSAALPWPYRYQEPGVTAGGRPVQGDALYLRDLASPMQRKAAAAVSDEKLAKLAAIFALTNLPDEAAEVLLTHEARLARIIDIDTGLNLLALQIQENDGTALSYPEYIAAFEAEAPQFMDQDGRRNVWLEGLKRAAGQ